MNTLRDTDEDRFPEMGTEAWGIALVGFGLPMILHAQWKGISVPRPLQPSTWWDYLAVYAFLGGCALLIALMLLLLGGVGALLAPQRLGGGARWGGQVFVRLVLLGLVLVFLGIGWLFLNWER